MQILIIGGGGHASDVLGVIEALNLEAAGLYDLHPIDPRRFEGRGVSQIDGRGGDQTDKKSVRPYATHFVLGIGWPAGRRRAVGDGGDLIAATLIHPRATVHPNARIGAGTVIMPGAIVSAGAVIGDHALIHHNAVIGHDAQVGDFVSVMPGASVSGDTVLGPGCLVGANATVIQGLTVGADAKVGAGAVVTRDVAPGTTVVGCPAR